MADEARDGYERVDGGCVLCVEGGEVVGAAGGGADGRAGEAVVRGGPCDAGGEVGAVGIGGGGVAGVEGGAEDFGLFQDELEAEWAEEGGEGVDDADGVRWLGRGGCGVVLCIWVLMGGGCDGGVIPKDC